MKAYPSDEWTDEKHAAVMKRPSCIALGKRLASVPPDFNELMDGTYVAIPGGFRVTLKSGVGFTVIENVVKSLIMLGWSLGWSARKARHEAEIKQE